MKASRLLNATAVFTSSRGPNGPPSSVAFFLLGPHSTTLTIQIEFMTRWFGEVLDLCAAAAALGEIYSKPQKVGNRIKDK